MVKYSLNYGGQAFGSPQLFTVYTSDGRGDNSNCSYPNKHIITDASSLAEAVKNDYVLAEYKLAKRSSANFVTSDCLPFDIDNDHSDKEEEWVTPEDVKSAFPGVTFAVHYSRNHMKEKNGKAPRPKFHILFPIDEVSNKDKYVAMKKKVKELFPFIDANALDAARFLFGTDEAKVDIFYGDMNLSGFFHLYDETSKDGIIPEGQRSNFLISYANKILKRYGDNDDAYDRYIRKSNYCMPPLDDVELNAIWNSAVRYYTNKISKEPGYIAPDRYNNESIYPYKPNDYSDVGQAEILAKYYKDVMRYSPSTLYICYSDGYWQENEQIAQKFTHELTKLQMEEAERFMAKARCRVYECGIDSILRGRAKSKDIMDMTDEQYDAYMEYQDAIVYKKFVQKQRDSFGVTGVMKQCRSFVPINIEEFDADPFMLCTPGATYDLRTGIARTPSSKDLNTKLTGVTPGHEGEELWLDALNTIFCGDKDLINYVQLLCGIVAVGMVNVEVIIIAYGSGRNGKSTFWNAISKVLGSYSGSLSAESLSTNCHHNIRPEMAEMQAKRLLIAAEMQEGTRLNDATIKQLGSTDQIFAEKKYKAPFAFTPSHTLVLYTNHLPKVSTNDDGTWRRLKVIPFNAKIEGASDKKNYADYLVKNAGGAILSWIIAGAKKAIEADFKFSTPDCVKRAIDDYREDNDWLGKFMEAKCASDDKVLSESIEVYHVYKVYTVECGEYTRSSQDFFAALALAGYKRINKNGKRYIVGLRILKDEDDFMKE